jgi:hypothetical protein
MFSNLVSNSCRWRYGFKFDSLLHRSQFLPLHHAAGSQISPLHHAAGSQISPLPNKWGVMSMIFAETSPLHDAVGKFDSQAAFYSGESNVTAI